MESKEKPNSLAAKSSPRFLNHFLIGAVVLLLGFFVVGKSLKLFQGEDAKSAEVSTTDLADVGSVDQPVVLSAKESAVVEETRDFSDLESFFGAKVVFVSAASPAYVVTDDERRFEIGNIPGTDVELASISSTQLVLEQAEELMVFILPGNSVN